jgi:ketosteroid isomerase-like protein
VPDAGITRQREVVAAFFAAAREGDFDALLAVLDPDVVVRLDAGPVPAGASTEVSGARAVAAQVLSFARFAGLGRPALVKGAAAWSPS